MRRLVVVLLLAGCAAPADGLPTSVAVLGDSISRATNVKGDDFNEWPVHSWATGNDPNDGVASHLERLRALDPTLDIVAFNDARSGARMSDLAAQADQARRQGASYVLVLMGANDVCDGTPLDTFRAQLEAASERIARIDARVLVASVPDVTRLVALYGDNETARAIWAAFRVCSRVLEPGADLEDARARTRAYNEALAAAARERGWSHDGGAVHDTLWGVADVSGVDLFHPSLAGQARLAEATWNASPFAAQIETAAP